MAIRTARRLMRSGWLGAAATAALFVAIASPAGAHQVWIEVGPTHAKFCFGEFGDNLKEVSPGYLDKLTRPEATLLGKEGKKVVKLSKQTDGYALDGKLALGQSLVIVDSAYPISERKEGDKTVRSAWTPAARYSTDLKAEAPLLTLDVLPTIKAGEFKVVFKGQPLGKASVSITLESGWSREGTTDSEGKVTFPLPWKAAYAVLVRHQDPTAGSRRGLAGEERFDVASFGTTLSFATQAGLPAPPPAPPTPPNKPEPPNKP